MNNQGLLPLLMLMVIFSPLAIDIFLPALPIMAEYFSVSVNQMQWSISIFLLSMGIGQLFTGPLLDRFGRKPVVLSGILIYAISSTLSAFSTSAEFFLMCRMAQGFGACAISVGAFASVRDRYGPQQSSTIFSYLNSTIFCIPALAPMLGHVLTEYFGWRSNFEFMASYAVCALCVLTLLLPETRPDSTVQQKKLISLTSYMSVVRHPVFLFNAITAMFTMAVILAYVSSSPGWLIVQSGLDQQTFVIWFSLNAVWNIIACAFAPKVMKKLGVRKTIESGLLLLILSGVLMVVLMGNNDVVSFMLPVMISSVGGALLMGPCAGQALSPFGNNAGVASAMFGFFQMSGAAILASVVQLFPLNVPEQLAFLMLIFLPLYVLKKLPRVKEVLYQLPTRQL